jgi:Uma2 family endonuclease
MSARPIVLTYEDYCELPDDGKRYEIHEGELVVNPAPTPGHQWVLGNLNDVIRRHVGERLLGKVFFAPLDCILENNTIVQPDLIFVANDRLDRISERGVEGAPTLGVEIASPSTTRIDRGRKMQLYSKFGVPFYWLVDPGVQLIEVFELLEGSYELLTRTSPDDRAQLAPFPDLTINLAEIWQ